MTKDCLIDFRRTINAVAQDISDYREFSQTYILLLWYQKIPEEDILGPFTRHESYEQAVEMMRYFLDEANGCDILRLKELIQAIGDHDAFSKNDMERNELYGQMMASFKEAFGGEEFWNLDRVRKQEVHVSKEGMKKILNCDGARIINEHFKSIGNNDVLIQHCLAYHWAGKLNSEYEDEHFAERFLGLKPFEVDQQSRLGMESLSRPPDKSYISAKMLNSMITAFAYCENWKGRFTGANKDERFSFEEMISCSDLTIGKTNRTILASHLLRDQFDNFLRGAKEDKKMWTLVGKCAARIPTTYRPGDIKLEPLETIATLGPGRHQKDAQLAIDHRESKSTAQSALEKRVTVAEADRPLHQKQKTEDESSITSIQLGMATVALVAVLVLMNS